MLVMSMPAVWARSVMLSAWSGGRVFGVDMVLDSASIFVVLCDFLGTRVLFGRIFVWLVVSLGCEGPIARLFPIRSRRSGHWVQLAGWFVLCLPSLLQWIHITSEGGSQLVTMLLAVDGRLGLGCSDSGCLSPQILQRGSGAWHLGVLCPNSQHLLHWISGGLSDHPRVFAITPKIESVLCFVRKDWWTSCESIAKTTDE